MAALLASLGAAVLAILAILLLVEFTETRGRLLLTGLTGIGFSLAGLGATGLRRRGRYRSLPEVAMLGEPAAFALLAAGIWATPDSDGFWKATGLVALLAASLGQLCLLLLWEPRGSMARLTLRVGSGAVTLLALLLSLAVLLEIRSNLYWWSVALVALVDIVVSLSALMLAWWSSSPPTQPRLGPGVSNSPR